MSPLMATPPTKASSEWEPTGNKNLHIARRVSASLHSFTVTFLGSHFDEGDELQTGDELRFTTDSVGKLLPEPTEPWVVPELLAPSSTMRVMPLTLPSYDSMFFVSGLEVRRGGGRAGTGAAPGAALPKAPSSAMARGGAWRRAPRARGHGGRGVDGGTRARSTYACARARRGMCRERARDRVRGRPAPAR